MTTTPATAATSGVREARVSSAAGCGGAADFDGTAGRGGGGGGGGFGSGTGGGGGGFGAATRGTGEGANGGAWTCAASKRWPHFGQNFAAAAQALPHCGQSWVVADGAAGGAAGLSGLPQPRQNLARGEFSAPHLAQAMTVSPFGYCSGERSAGIPAWVWTSWSRTDPRAYPPDKLASVECRPNCRGETPPILGRAWSPSCDALFEPGHRISTSRRLRRDTRRGRTSSSAQRCWRSTSRPRRAPIPQSPTWRDCAAGPRRCPAG